MSVSSTGVPSGALSFSTGRSASSLLPERSLVTINGQGWGRTDKLMHWRPGLNNSDWEDARETKLRSAACGKPCGYEVDSDADRNARQVGCGKGVYGKRQLARSPRDIDQRMVYRRHHFGFLAGRALYFRGASCV